MVVAKYIKKGCVVAGTFLAGLTCSSLPGLFFFFFGGEPKLSFPPFFGPLFLINVLVKPAMLVILLAAPFDRSKSFFFENFERRRRKREKGQRNENSLRHLGRRRLCPRKTAPNHLSDTSTCGESTTARLRELGYLHQ